MFKNPIVETSTVPAPRNSMGLITTPAPQRIFRSTFSKTLSSVDSDFFTVTSLGTGQTVSQASGNLIISSGVAINAETILRSKVSFVGNLITRIQAILSQRISNQTFFFELVDVIGDNLVAVASSSSSLTVTIPDNPFNADNIGQSMYVGNLSGGLAGIPNRYSISGISGNDVTFTVASFVPSTGTVSIFGWNYYHTVCSGTVATAAGYDSQRKGWNSGDTAITSNNTAAPGTMFIMGNEDGNAWVADQLVASTAGASTSMRGSRVINLPDEFTNLYFQIRVLNSSVAPASNTTLTIGTISIENYTATPVSSYNTKPQTTANASLMGAVQTLITNGQTAHSLASNGNPVRVGGKVTTTLDTTLIQGDASDLMQTSAGQVIQKPFGSAENDWQYAPPVNGISNSVTAVTIKAAGAASIRNYITGITIMAEALGAATELVIRDGAAGTVLFRIKIPVTGLVTNQINFPTPLKGTAATLLEIATLTASGTGSVYVNAQGYQSV